MSRLITLMLLLTVFSVPGCNTSHWEQNLAPAFDAVSIGQDKPTIVSRLGTPTEITYRNVLGLTYESLTWYSAERVYQVELVSDKVVYKSVGNRSRRGGYATQ